MGLSAGSYLAGVAELAAIVAALAFAAARLRTRLLPDWSGAPARLAEAVMAIAALLWISELLGLVGLFEEWPLVIACVILGAGVGAGVRWLGSGDRAGAGGGDRDCGAEGTLFPGASPGGRRSTAPSRLQLAVALAVIAVLFAEWAIPTLESLGRGMYGFDTQWYHMPFAARFAQSGEIWPFLYTSPVYLSWFYPANSELLHATGILAFGRDLLSPALNLGWLSLALLAAWCVGRPWGVPGWSLLGAGVVLAGGVFADQPGDARNDIVALALILSSGALLAHAGRLAASPAVVIAALAAGLALGTRLTGLAPVGALTIGVVALAPRGERGRAALAWLVPLLAAGGLWYLRNLVGSGNPLPWIDNLGPLALPGPDQELGGREPLSVAHYATDFEVWGEWFAPALRTTLGLLWPGVLVLAAAGAVLAAARSEAGDAVVRLLGAVAVVGAVVYFFTPVTAATEDGNPLGFQSNLRYLTAPLALALALVPVALARAAPGWRYVGLAALGAAFVAAASDPDRWEDGYLGGALAVATAAAAVVLLVWALAPARPAARWARPLAAAGLAALAVAAVGGGYAQQREYLRDRYASVREVLPNPGLDTVFEWARDVRDARIGTITTRQYPLYGTDLSNHVEFIGLQGSSASFTRARGCAQWREAVDTGDYDYVITAFDRQDPDNPVRPPEEGWTKGSGSASVVAADGPATVFRLDGPLDPAQCR